MVRGDVPRRTGLGRLEAGGAGAGAVDAVEPTAIGTPDAVGAPGAVAAATAILTPAAIVAVAAASAVVAPLAPE